MEALGRPGGRASPIRLGGVQIGDQIGRGPLGGPQDRHGGDGRDVDHPVERSIREML